MPKMVGYPLMEDFIKGKKSNFLTPFKKLKILKIIVKINKIGLD